MAPKWSCGRPPVPRSSQDWGHVVAYRAAPRALASGRTADAATQRYRWSAATVLRPYQRENSLPPAWLRRTLREALRRGPNLEVAIGHVRHRWLRRISAGGPHSARRARAPGIPRLRLRRCGAAERGRAANAEARGQGAGPRRSPVARTGARDVRYRAHPLGDARSADGCQRPPPHRLRWGVRTGAQR